MAVVVESVSTTDIAEGAISITKPTGLAVDDLMVVPITLNDAGNTISTPSGYTSLTTIIESYNANAFLFYKLAESADVAAGSFSFDVDDGTGQLGGTMIRLSGVDLDTEVENLSTATDASAGTSRSHTVSLTPSFGNSVLVAIVTHEGLTQTISSFASTGTPTWTQQQRIAVASSTQGAFYVFTAPYTPTTEVTSVTFTTSASVPDSTVNIFAVRPLVDGDGAVTASTVNLTGNVTISSSTNVTVGRDDVDVTSNAVSAPSRNGTVWTDETRTSTTWTDESK